MISCVGSPIICLRQTERIYSISFCQSRSTFSLRQAMDEGKIVLINLAQGLLGQHLANFLGMVFVVGTCSAAFYGFLPLYLPELFPTRVRATGQGFCYNFGRSLAAVGVLITNFGLNLKGEYARTGAVIVLVYLVGMVLVWFAPETRGQPLPE